MAANDDKAADWVDKAEKKLKGFSLFGGNKLEEAADMFIKGANLFKMSKKWDQAGAAFVRAAECQVKQSKYEAATNYFNAANCYKKSNVTDAISCLRTAVELYTDEGRFSIAAKHQKEIAELYEGEMEYESCMEAYQQAADFYEGEGSSSAANGCLLKVAQYSAQLEKYDKAIEIFEQVAKNSLDNNLLKWSCKEYFLKSGLCYMASGDVVSAKRAVEKYQEMDVTFSSQRECKFLQELVASCENFDTDAFTQAVVDYDSISKLDQWKTTILLRVKNTLKAEDNLS
jgi:alpha-soluble NSF attachment protein